MYTLHTGRAGVLHDPRGAPIGEREVRFDVIGGASTLDCWGTDDVLRGVALSLALASGLCVPREIKSPLTMQKLVNLQESRREWPKHPAHVPSLRVRSHPTLTDVLVEGYA